VCVKLGGIRFLEGAKNLVFNQGLMCRLAASYCAENLVFNQELMCRLAASYWPPGDNSEPALFRNLVSDCEEGCW